MRSQSIVPIQERNRQILQMRKEGVPRREVALRFGLSPNRISQLEQRKGFDHSMVRFWIDHTWRKRAYWGDAIQNAGRAYSGIYQVMGSESIRERAVGTEARTSSWATGASTSSSRTWPRRVRKPENRQSSCPSARVHPVPIGCGRLPPPKAGRALRPRTSA